MSKGIVGPISTQWAEGTTEEQKAVSARQGLVASAASGLNEAFRYPDTETIVARLETLLEVIPAWAKDNESAIDPNGPLAQVLRLNLGIPGLAK